MVLKALKCGVYKFQPHSGDKNVHITVEELSSFQHFSVEGTVPLKFIDCLSDLNNTKSKKARRCFSKCSWMREVKHLKKLKSMQLPTMQHLE